MAFADVSKVLGRMPAPTETKAGSEPESFAFSAAAAAERPARSCLLAAAHCLASPELATQASGVKYALARQAAAAAAAGGGLAGLVVPGGTVARSLVPVEDTQAVMIALNAAPGSGDGLDGVRMFLTPALRRVPDASRRGILAQVAAIGDASGAGGTASGTGGTAGCAVGECARWLTAAEGRGVQPPAAAAELRAAAERLVK